MAYPYIFNPKPLDSDYISSSVISQISTNISTIVESENITFRYFKNDIDSIMNTVGAKNSEYSIDIYISETSGLPLYDNTSKDYVSTINNNTVATDGNVNINKNGINQGVNHNYHYYIKYIDNKYDIDDVFVIRQPFTTLPLLDNTYIIASGLYEAGQGNIFFTISQDISTFFNTYSYSLTIKVKQLNSLLYSNSIDLTISDLTVLEYDENGEYQILTPISTYAGGTPLNQGDYLYKVTIFDINGIKLGTCETVVGVTG